MNINVQVAAAILGIVAVLVGALSAADLFGKLIALNKQRHETHLVYETRNLMLLTRAEHESGITPATPIDQAQITKDEQDLKKKIQERLNEAKDLQQAKEKTAKRTRRSAIWLAIGQYIVGGIIATSFIQQSLAPHIINVLGLLVLISTLIRQKFNPDLTASTAARQAHLIRSFRRSTEDRLTAVPFIKQTPEAVISEYLDILMSASKFLASIEHIDARVDDSLSVTPHRRTSNV
jgi:hypothetical protein